MIKRVFHGGHFEFYANEALEILQQEELTLDLVLLSQMTYISQLRTLCEA